MDIIPFPQMPNMFGQNFPKVDVRETLKDVIVVADVPGIDPKKVNVEISESSVKISGSVQQEKETKGKNFHRKERMIQSFSRVIPLPCPVKHEGVKAMAKNGTLTITLPKKNEDQPKMKKIPVEEA
ncbi:MAG: Hsp20/alpha crystallin family protein [Candidatus Gracilibacteria bacterium]